MRQRDPLGAIFSGPQFILLLRPPVPILKPPSSLLRGVAAIVGGAAATADISKSVRKRANLVSLSVE
jgi:hypothetical protein